MIKVNNFYPVGSNSDILVTENSVLQNQESVPIKSVKTTKEWYSWLFFLGISDRRRNQVPIGIWIRGERAWMISKSLNLHQGFSHCCLSSVTPWYWTVWGLDFIRSQTGAWLAVDVWIFGFTVIWLQASLYINTVFCFCLLTNPPPSLREKNWINQNGKRLIGTTHWWGHYRFQIRGLLRWDLLRRLWISAPVFRICDHDNQCDLARLYLTLIQISNLLLLAQFYDVIYSRYTIGFVAL